MPNAVIGSVEIRWARIDEVAVDASALAAEERESYERIRHPRRASEWLAGRTLAKQWLAARIGAGVAPSAIAVLSGGAPGRASAPRPFWRGSALPWSLSMAHVDGLVFVAVAGSWCDGVGIDVVPLDRVVPGHLSMWMTDVEHAWTNAAGSPRARTCRAAAVWACKEAAYKAANGGEAFRPASVAIEPRQTGVWRAYAAERTVRVRPFALDGHVGATAVSGDNRGVR